MSDAQQANPLRGVAQNGVKDEKEKNAAQEQHPFYQRMYKQQADAQAVGRQVAEGKIDERIQGKDTTGESGSGVNGGAETAAAAAAAAAAGETTADASGVGSSARPVAGTDEWHKVRKSNHKEVERRRRESINSGIKELAALLPNQDANKAQVLRRAVEYIKRLKENEDNNIEKWTLEKLLTDQAVSELASSNEKLKQELEKAYREIEHWKKIASNKNA